jgi:hypothetical protein
LEVGDTQAARLPSFDRATTPCSAIAPRIYLARLRKRSKTPSRKNKLAELTPVHQYVEWKLI